MMARVTKSLLIAVLGLSLLGCNSTLRVGVLGRPTPAPGATADAIATLDAAVRATLAAPKATPTTSPDVDATVQAAVAATVAASGAAAAPEPTALLTAPAEMPAVLFSTYFGGAASDELRDVAVDGEGSVHIVGTTSSPDLPTTPGAYDNSLDGSSDVFVGKLSADGSTLLYGTYLGGSGDDLGDAIALDGEGNVYVTGHTFSVDFPTTPGAQDRSLTGERDAFVVKLSPAGELIYGTYLGGDNWDYGFCIAVDDAGSAYVGGFTHGDFPVTPGAAQTTFGGYGDGFVARLSPDGSSLIYSTYVGGWSWEAIQGIAVDPEGNAYLATSSPSDDFPTTLGAYDTVCESCLTDGSDAVAVKLSADGRQFVYSTFVGGEDPKCNENLYDVVLDSAGNAYLVGDSSAVSFPTTPGALQRAFGGGEYDAVVVKLNADGSDLLYSTYLGGAGFDSGRGIVLDEAGNAYVAGFSGSVDFPTAFAAQPAKGGGRDAFVAALDQDASTLLLGTYFGGSGDEAKDGAEYVGLEHTAYGAYLVGVTSSTDLPTTVGAHDTSFSGGASDGFVVRLSPLGGAAVEPTRTPPPTPAATPGVEGAAPTFTRVAAGAIVNDGGRSSGACWGDYDNDGYPDLFVANWGGENNFLYHNGGDGTFARVTEGALVTDGGWSRSCTWGDYDNDGFLDLFVSNDGGGNFLYHNEGGAAFSRVLSGPIAEDDGNCYGAGWADYDNDGWLDLFVARHTNAPDLLYHNQGDGTFERVTAGEIVNDSGSSMPAGWGDYDGDGCVDLHVGTVDAHPNFLYHNTCDGSFQKIATGPVAVDLGFSSTLNWVDYDNDADLDLFVGNWREDNALFCNDGRGAFTRCVTGEIVTDSDAHDSSWGDYDLDGDMDLFVGGASGTQRLYQNNGDGSFARVAAGPIVEDRSSSGGLWGDYDNDGDLDLFVAVDTGANNHLYRNEGSGHHWLQLTLAGAAPERTQAGRGTNRSAIGARVAVTATISGRTVQQVQEVSGQTGMFSQNGLRLTFGLGDAPIVSAVTIRWPSGVVQTLADVAVDQMLTVQEALGN